MADRANKSKADTSSICFRSRKGPEIATIAGTYKDALQARATKHLQIAAAPVAPEA